MNEEMPRTGLATALDRATDRIHDPQLATKVLAEVHRRRSRRGVLAVAGTAASVAIVVVALQLPGRPGDRQPAGPVNPSGTPSMPADVETRGPLNGVQPQWDPFTVTDQPFHRTGLPARLAPPPTAPSVADQPMSAAVVAWPEKGHDLRLLGTDGTWRSVPGTATSVAGTLRDVVDPALSSDGRQVAMSTNDGILVVDVTTGVQRTIPWPDELADPWDTAPGLRWLPDDDGFAVLHWRDTWLVDLDGVARKAPYGGPYGSGLAFDPAGGTVERRWKNHDLRVWQGDRVVSTATFPYWGERFVTRFGRVAFTGSGGGLPPHGGPMVLDADSGELLAYAPIRDPNAIYTDNAHLSAKGFLDKDTVLLLVAPMDFRTMQAGDETWHLVAWNIRDGAFERLTSGDTGMRGIDVAVGLLSLDWTQ